MLRGSVPTVNSSAQHTFSRAPQAGIPRSKFNRTFGVKTTFDEGYLVPILADEMLPGDTFSLKMHAFSRISTLLFPIMDNLYMETFFFFVPNRLLWTNWEKFCGFQVNPGDTTDYTIPQMTVPVSDGFPEGSLGDYFGIPTNINSITKPNSLHFRAYNLIWNEWFRDENMQDSVTVDTGNGPDNPDNYLLLRRGKRRDYFTSCLPWPQKGPEVLLPLSGTAPVTGLGYLTTGVPLTGTTPTLTDSTGVPVTYSNWYTTTGGAADFYIELSGNTPPAAPQLFADLAAATATNVNDLRLAFQTQKFYEKQARGGTRYTEVIKSHFNVVSPDMRLQRPEYIGGGSTPVIINPVAQTTPSATPTDKNALANLGAYGVCAPESHGFTYSATEHGVVLGLVMVRADINYQYGLDRMWTRQVFTDYYWPVFSHLGEQAVLNQEIYAQGTGGTDPAIDTKVFGYQERYAEYRYKPSLITGLFRSNATGSLDAWHLAQDFGSLPTLNGQFISEDAPMDRIQAFSDGYDFLFDAVFAYHCARPMPVYGVPGLVDHF